jgi:hypothetical protein
MTYPNDCVQYLFDKWWTDEPHDPFCRGRLVWAPVVNVEQVPFEFVPVEREDSREHARARLSCDSTI